MSAIDPNQFNIAPSPQDLLDEAYVNSELGAGQAASTQASDGPTEPPQEQALDALNDFTHAAQNQFNQELIEGVPSDLLNAQQMTSTLVGSVTANATQALAAAAQTLQPDAVLALLQP